MKKLNPDTLIFIITLINNSLKLTMEFQAYTLSKYPEYAYIQLKSPDVHQRPPVHLCVILDTSGSMEDNSKLKNVKESLMFMLNFLTPSDKLSIVTFSQSAKIVLQHVNITTTEKENIHTQISLIGPESITNLSTGLITAHQCLLQDQIYKQGILLLTDGHANAGVIDTDKIVDIVRTLVGKYNGTSISCVGYNTDHNASLLENISAEGGGSYYVVNNLEDVATVFGDILGSLLSCVAQQVQITLPNTKQVKTRYPVQEINSYIKISVGDMPTNYEAIILAKIPQGTIISANGYDITTHDMFYRTTVVTTTDDQELQTNGEVHYLRFKVLDILNVSKSYIHKLVERELRITDKIITNHIGDITELYTQITDYKANNQHSLWDTLLFELDECKKALENMSAHTMDTTQMLLQHISVLGLMRGIPATPIRTASHNRLHMNTTQSNNSINNLSTITQCNSDADPTDIYPSFILPRFSNSVQRQISSQMQTVCSQHPLSLLPRSLDDEFRDSFPLSQIYDYSEDAES